MNNFSPYWTMDLRYLFVLQWEKQGCKNWSWNWNHLRSRFRPLKMYQPLEWPSRWDFLSGFWDPVYVSIDSLTQEHATIIVVFLHSQALLAWWWNFDSWLIKRVVRMYDPRLLALDETLAYKAELLVLPHICRICSTDQQGSRPSFFLIKAIL